MSNAKKSSKNNLTAIFFFIEGNDFSKDEILKETKTLSVNKALLLLIIDHEFKDEFSEATNKIMKIKKMLEQLKNSDSYVDFDIAIEWGKTTNKLLSVAMFNKPCVILLKKRENKFFEEIIEKLKEEGLKYKVL